MIAYSKHKYFYIMKKLLFLAVATLAALSAAAQDLIVTRDGQRIDAKITEVSSTEIRYKEWNNQDGPTFVLRSDELNTIIYQNGTVKTFEHAPAPTTVTYTVPSKAEPVYGPIVKDDNDVYTVGNRRMSEDEYIDFIRQNCKEAYDYYESGVSLWSAGWKLFGLGVGFTFGGAVWYCVGWYVYGPYYNDNYWNERSYYRAFTIGGAVLMGLGGLAVTGSVPCLIVGGIRKNNSHNVYNESCVKQQTVATFGIQPAPGGLGLAIKF